jgi:hypothetical protein
MFPRCNSVRLFITKPWQAFDDFVSDSAPRKELVACTETLQLTSGSVRLPAEIMTDSGVHQVVVLPLDKTETMCNLERTPVVSD